MNTTLKNHPLKISMDNYLLQPQHHSQQQLFPPQNFMSPLSLSSKLKQTTSTLLFSKPFFSLHYFCCASQNVLNPIELTQKPINVSTNNSTISKNKVQNLKDNWLSSLSINGNNKLGFDEINNNNGVDWIIGVDPDVSGALALLKFDLSGCISSEVFDSPFVQVHVGKTSRKRLDARSIIQLLQRIDAPIGTTAYLEQSIPFPQDGKLGWWSGGFNYGIWIGILVASGFSVVPVPSALWKKEFDLARGSSSKDDSRELASRLFPDLSSMMKRKKDHGRAEALLIAAYGRELKLKEGELSMSDDTHEILTKL